MTHLYVFVYIVVVIPLVHLLSVIVLSFWFLQLFALFPSFLFPPPFSSHVSSFLLLGFGGWPRVLHIMSHMYRELNLYGSVLFLAWMNCNPSFFVWPFILIFLVCFVWLLLFFGAIPRHQLSLFLLLVHVCLWNSSFNTAEQKKPSNVYFVNASVLLFISLKKSEIHLCCSLLKFPL